MARLLLDVPIVAQSRTNTCWHSCSEMIWWYWQGVTGRQGPMTTLGDHWSANNPVQPADFGVLARAVGLETLPATPMLTSETLAGALKQAGPLWCAGYWYGPGHVVVLTGIEGENVHINDPDGGVRKVGLLSWFNTKLAWHVGGCLMRKSANAY